MNEELAEHAENLKRGENLDRTLGRLRYMDAPLEMLKKYDIRKLVEPYLEKEQFKTIVTVVLERSQKMEAGEKEKENDFKEPVRTFRPRKRPCQPNVVANSTPIFKIPRINMAAKKPPLLDVSKMRNLPEEEYDRIRPTLIHLPAIQLKSFMDRNPEIEKIADGLFRRHCQMDCPEEVSKKMPSEKWRTLHDVHVNWKQYEEIKKWETMLKERLKREEQLLWSKPETPTTSSTKIPLKK